MVILCDPAVRNGNQGDLQRKTALTNLALEGLQGMGAFIGAFVAVLAAGYFGSNSQVPYYLAIVCAMAGGMLYSLLYGHVMYPSEGKSDHWRSR